MSSNKYEDIPASACTFGAELHLGDNGDGASTAPVRMLARSSKPIEHWFWGNVVHDTSGFSLNGRKRLSIDADHDPSQAIGYANRFEVEPDGLYMSGSIISHFEQDRADKIMRDMKSGIPYEASINFGGDGIKVEEVREGESASVNGYEFAGPGVIIREWPLRNVAICLLGADQNTQSQVFNDSGTVTATVLSHKEEAVMETTDKQKAKEVEESTVELAQVEAAEEVETATNEEATELSQAVEEEAVEVVPEGAAVEAVDAEADTPDEVLFTQSAIADMVTEFGHEIALQVVTNGGTYADAKQLQSEADRAELLALREEVASLKAATPAKAAKVAAFSSNDAPGKPAKKNYRDAAVRRSN